MLGNFLKNYQKIYQEEVISFFKKHDLVQNPERLFERLLERGVFHP